MWMIWVWYPQMHKNCRIWSTCARRGAKKPGCKSTLTSRRSWHSTKQPSRRTLVRNQRRKEAKTNEERRPLKINLSKRSKKQWDRKTLRSQLSSLPDAYGGSKSRKGWELKPKEGVFQKRERFGRESLDKCGCGPNLVIPTTKISTKIILFSCPHGCPRGSTIWNCANKKDCEMLSYGAWNLSVAHVIFPCCLIRTCSLNLLIDIHIYIWRT